MLSPVFCTWQMLKIVIINIFQTVCSYKKLKERNIESCLCTETLKRSSCSIPFEESSLPVSQSLWTKWGFGVEGRVRSSCTNQIGCRSCSHFLLWGPLPSSPASLPGTPWHYTFWVENNLRQGTVPKRGKGVKFRTDGQPDFIWLLSFKSHIQTTVVLYAFPKSRGGGGRTFEKLLPGMPVLLLQAVVPRDPGAELTILLVCWALAPQSSPGVGNRLSGQVSEP